MTIPSRGYFLASLERTGSTILTDALKDTGVAGRPTEYFNPSEQSEPWMQKILQGASVVDGFDRIIAAGTTPNGVFGAKIHWSHWRYLGLSTVGRWGPGVPAATPLLPEGFSDLRPMAAAHDLLQSRLPDLRVVWLRRRNMVARAISHFRADRSGLWYVRQSAADADSAPGETPPDFDFGEIHRLNCLGQFQDAMWLRFFRAQAIEPFEVNYEDLIADRDATVRRVLAFAGIDAAALPISPVRLQRQSDALSLQWEDRGRVPGRGVARW